MAGGDQRQGIGQGHEQANAGKRVAMIFQQHNLVKRLSVLKNVLVGKQQVDEGHIMRGVETMLPKGLKDMIKAGRYATQGVNTLRGDPVVADLSPWEILLQANGFVEEGVLRQAIRKPDGLHDLRVFGLLRDAAIG